MSLKCIFDKREGFFIHINLELLSLNFKEIKFSQDASLKRLLITLLSKIASGCVTFFQIENYRLVRCNRMT